MNSILGLLKILLALWNITGGMYMATHYNDLISNGASHVFPSFFWIGLGFIQVLFSLGLLASFIKKLKKLVPVSIIGLATIDFLGIFFYQAYRGFPGMLWGIIPAILLVFVLYRND